MLAEASGLLPTFVEHGQHLTGSNLNRLGDRALQIDIARRAREYRFGSLQESIGFVVAELHLVGVPRRLGRRALRVAVAVDARAVLGPDVVALPHPLGRVVALPEGLQELLIGQLGRVEYHRYCLGVSGLS